jgi:hypothetical protein
MVMQHRWDGIAWGKLKYCEKKNVLMLLPMTKNLHGMNWDGTQAQEMRGSRKPLYVLARFLNTKINVK